MLLTVAQIFKPGGFVDSPGTPNFLLDVGQWFKQIQWRDAQVGGILDATFTLRKQYEDDADTVAGDWMVFGCRGGLLAADTAAGASQISVSDALRPLWTSDVAVGKNLAPSSDFDPAFVDASWTDGASGKMPVTIGVGPKGSGEANGANALVYTGTGAASGTLQRYALVNVTPGQTLILSVYVDPSHITAGSAIIGILSADLSTQLETLEIPVGAAQRYGTAAWTVPSGTTQIAIVLGTNDCTVANGEPLIFAQPQLEVGSAASSYETSALDLCEFRVGDSLIITDGANSEIFKVASVGGFPGTTATIGLSAAQSQNASTLLNSYAAGALTSQGFSGTKVARLIFQSLVTGRQRTTEWSNAFALKTNGMSWRYQKVLTGYDLQAVDCAKWIYDFCYGFAPYIPEIVVSEDNFADKNGILYTGTGTKQAVWTLLQNMLQVEAGGGVPSGSSEASVWSIWVDELRQVHHAELPTPSWSGPTFTIDLLNGSIFGDVAGPLQPTDMDMSRLLNCLVVDGGLDSNGNQVTIIVTHKPSYTQWGYYEGYLSNTNIGGAGTTIVEQALALWAAGQLGVLAWPQQTGRLTLNDCSLRLSSRDLLEITGFSDGSTLVTNPTEIQYTVDLEKQSITATVSLTQQQPNFASIMAEIANQKSIRAATAASPATQVVGSYVVSGFDVATDGLNYSIGPGVVCVDGQTYNVPGTSGTMTAPEAIHFGVQVAGTAPDGVSLPAIVPLPKFQAVSSLQGNNWYELQDDGGGSLSLSQQTDFVGVRLVKLTATTAGAIATIALAQAEVAAFASSASPAFTLGSAPTVGNVIVARVFWSGGATFSVPAGWTSIDDATESTLGVATLYRVVQTGDTAAFSFASALSASSPWEICAGEFSGVDTTSPIDAHAVAGAAGVGVTLPAVTPGGTGRFALCDAVGWNGSGTIALSTGPDGFTLDQEVQQTGVAAVFAYYAGLPTGSLAASWSFTGTPTDCAASIILLAPGVAPQITATVLGQPQGGIGTQNLKPPSGGAFTASLIGLTVIPEGAASACAQLAFSLTGVVFDDSISEIDVSWSIAGQNQWHPSQAILFTLPGAAQPTSDVQPPPPGVFDVGAFDISATDIPGTFVAYVHGLAAGQAYDIGVTVRGTNGQPLNAAPIVLGTSPTISAAAITAAIATWNPFGGTLNTDGSWSKVDGATSAQTWPLPAGSMVRVSGEFAKGATSSPSAVIVGNTTNGYGLEYDGSGNVRIVKYVAGVKTVVGSSVAETNDTKYHTLTLTIGVQGASNNRLWATWDAVDPNTGLTVVDTALDLTAASMPVTVYTGGAAGKLLAYGVSTQLQLGPTSSALNPQASLLNWGNTPTLSYSTTTTSITLTIPSTTFTRTDKSTGTVPAFSQTWSSLTPGATYYFDVYYDAINNVFVAVAYGTTAPTNLQIMADNYTDGRVPISSSYSVTTPTSGTGGGSSPPVRPPIQACPADYQLVRSREREYVRADELEVGMHVPSPAGGWTRITALRVLPCEVYELTLESQGRRETLAVNDGHMVMAERGGWIVACEADAGMRVRTIDGDGATIAAVRSCGRGRYVALTVEEPHTFVLGRTIAHNVQTL